jgi:putative radical SAM enzyme (TIGR03279 family)
VIVGLAPEGLGAEIGLRVGDRLLAVNGHALRDVLDLQFYGADEEIALSVWREGETVGLRGRRRYGQPWGVAFERALFDGIKTCTNHCPFCFLKGLPAGLRPSLYIRDDDYRLSFLHGSFVTLTNLEEADWQRLAEQHLSPLYVSVHATDPDLRRRLLGVRFVPDIREQLRRLRDLGIGVHAQVVVCPGLNDGEALLRTIADLWELRNVVETVSLVPVGLSAHHPARLERVTPAMARDLLALADDWRRRAHRESGRRFVYPSDELYLLAGRAVPGAQTYEGFPQAQNGVGLVRLFLEDWARTKRRLRRQAPRMAISGATLVTGLGFEPHLARVACDLGEMLGIACRVIGVENRFFGEPVTVAGLLTARDVIEQLSGKELGDVVILPRSMLDAAGERTLDDWSLAEVGRALGRPVVTAGLASEVVGALTRQYGALP